MSKYLKWYDNLCASRKLMSRRKGNGVYYEEHHIKPKWMGGLDESNNLVLLTGREHYLAHYLLFKHFKDRSSSAAFHIMNISVNSDNLDSKKYEEVRLFQAENLKGDKNPSKSKEVRHKISLKSRGEGNGMYGVIGKDHPRWGSTHSKEFRDYKMKLHGRKIEFNGVRYESIRQAHRETGVSRYLIKKNSIIL